MMGGVRRVRRVRRAAAGNAVQCLKPGSFQGAFKLRVNWIDRCERRTTRESRETPPVHTHNATTERFAFARFCVQQLILLFKQNGSQ
jgi:hypothetical protein